LAVCGRKICHAPDRGARRASHRPCLGANILRSGHIVHRGERGNAIGPLRCADSAWRTTGGGKNDAGRSATTMGSVSWHDLDRGLYSGSRRWLAGAGATLLGLYRGWRRAEACHGPLDLAGHGASSSALPTLIEMGAIL